MSPGETAAALSAIRLGWEPTAGDLVWVWRKAGIYVRGAVLSIDQDAQGRAVYRTRLCSSSAYVRDVDLLPRVSS